MARIWLVFEGNDPTQGEGVEMPLAKAIALFSVDKRDYLSALDEPPRFPGAWISGRQHTVMELGRKEAEKEGWKAGFYEANIHASEAYDILLRDAIVGSVGTDHVTRIEHRSAMDSEGDPALAITVFLAPGSADKVSGMQLLRAQVELNSRMRDLGDLRTPIMSFTTSKELIGHASL